MKIYKLNAIDSTNDYLKQLALKIPVEDYSIVKANYQKNGKGQLGNTWHSKKDKNLLFSVLVRFSDFKISEKAYLNFAISKAIYEVLNQYLDDVKIKWPNDIMSRNKKVCGILIENSVKNGRITQSIVGVGLNVNQVKFPDNLPNATSLKIILNRDFDINDLLTEIVISIKKNMNLIHEKAFDKIKTAYKAVLFRIEKPAMYKTLNGHLFMGKLRTVTDEGLLQIELEDETIKEFSVKEIVFV
ncbi:MAG: biotin--[acetyl-CoA-carboxylase] ligase [Flavobacteriaceae bacterium]